MNALCRAVAQTLNLGIETWAETAKLEHEVSRERVQIQNDRLL